MDIRKIKKLIELIELNPSLTYLDICGNRLMEQGLLQVRRGAGG